MSRKIHPWWYGGSSKKTSKGTEDLIFQYRGALLRISSGDAGDWTCNCPAKEIAMAALEKEELKFR